MSDVWFISIDCYFDRFCRRRNEDPVEALRRCDAALFKVYLDLRVKRSRIKKESTIFLYWKRLSQVYAQKAATWMSDSILFDIRNKEKAGILIDDLAIMLNHLWIRDDEVFSHERLRVQLSANLILAGATATRPGALIGQLLYENLEFQVFPPVLGDNRPRIALIVNLEHIKRTAGSSEAKRFAFREDDMLLYDPLIPIMALAFCDDAFLNNIEGPQDLYNLVVPYDSDRIRLLWKKEWLKRPVFRDVEATEDGIQISANRALDYRKERQHLIRLGRAIGIEKQLEWYDLRRGSGKKLNEALTPEERNKIMGHRKGDSSTYLQYYMSNFIDVDCQSICFGTAPQHDLVQLAARLRRHDGAPKELTVDQLAAIHNNKKLVEYREGRRRAVLDWKQQGYRSREEAKGTEMWERYDHYNKEANKLLNWPLPTSDEIRNASKSELSPRRSAWGDGGGMCLIRGVYVVKFGATVTENEGNALLFVEKHLEISAPRLYAMYHDPPSGPLHLVMEYIRGADLESVWESLSVEAKSSIATQLQPMFAQMRSLGPPDDFIGGVCGGGIPDPVFQTDWPNPSINGPFRNAEEFAGGKILKETRKLLGAFSGEMSTTSHDALCRFAMGSVAGAVQTTRTLSWKTA
ncbi:hypothetical protein O9K51_04882 [Purpureocillium lavendulum]|uniref:Uncharacterized protein n=1 Tax=Purpureocillium lavendulum TaxID=1247861 RepID=A0AB34FY27_9HYPO|nr:hypothetical protein O9K51_04882 [Purpureocillium lavendulum]